MHTSQTAVAAYGRRQQAVASGRAQEWDALARTTRMLKAARESGDIMETARAVSTQFRLWSIFVTDLADPGNALPETLRKQLAGIGAVVLREASYAPDSKVDFDFHIEINETIMAGLRGE